MTVLVIMLVVRPAPSAAATPVGESRQIWLRDCAVCHGADGRGTSVAPSLERVGRASVDYYVSTGRMPLLPVGRSDARGRPLQPLVARAKPDPDAPVGRHAPAYDPATIRSLVAYVGALVADGGPPIPRLHSGRVAEGGELYRLNCAACHAWSGSGGALLHREAPPLHDATGTQVAEAVRIGPGNMPSFGGAALSDRDVSDVIAYIDEMNHPDDRGGMGLRHLGPIAEGAVGLAALALVLWLCLWIGDRSRPELDET